MNDSKLIAQGDLIFRGNDPQVMDESVAPPILRDISNHLVYFCPATKDAQEMYTIQWRIYRGKIFTTKEPEMTRINVVSRNTSRFSLTYKELSDEDQSLVNSIKLTAEALALLIEMMPSPESSIAMTYLETAVMWAVKGVCMGKDRDEKIDTLQERIFELEKKCERNFDRNWTE